MANILYIWSDLDGRVPMLAGALEIASGVQGATGLFQYNPDYVAAGQPAIDPINLPIPQIVSGGLITHVTAAFGGLYPAFSDAGPDAWGRRVLLNLHPRQMAKKSAFTELLLSAGTGVGSLRFSASRTSLKERMTLPTPADLGAAAEAMQTIELGLPLRAQLRELVAAGTSIGGLNPKILLADTGGTYIFKFKSRDDAYESPLLESACMKLAEACGINVAQTMPTAVGMRACIKVTRFDVDAEGRRSQYLSAHALFNRDRANDQAKLTWASYVAIAELIRKFRPDPTAELHELYRRMCLNVIIGNTDDHARNHGFVGKGNGSWSLSPAFDICPPLGSQAQEHALGIGTGGAARSIPNLLSKATSFNLGHTEAKAVVELIRETVRTQYRLHLDQAGVSKADQIAALERVIV